MKFIAKICCLILLIIFGGCSKEEPVYTVKVVAQVSDGAYARISGIKESSQNGVKFTDKLEKAFTTDYIYGAITMYCDDRKALLSLKVWVNGKLVVDEIGNSRINSGSYIQKYLEY